MGSAAAPRHAPAIARAAAVAAAAPCAALRDGVRASVVGGVVACAGPLAPALPCPECLQCAELWDPLRCNELLCTYRCNAYEDHTSACTEAAADAACVQAHP